MRFIISAVGAVLALSTVSATPSAAQTAQQQSLTQLTNSCIDLARQRGWAESDIANNRREISEFRRRAAYRAERPARRSSQSG